MKDKHKNIKLKKGKEAREAEIRKKNNPSCNYCEDEIDEHHSQRDTMLINTDYFNCEEPIEKVKPLYEEDKDFQGENFDAIFVTRSSSQDINSQLPSRFAYGDKAHNYYGGNKKNNNYTIIHKNDKDYERTENDTKEALEILKDIQTYDPELNYSNDKKLHTGLKRKRQDENVFAFNKLQKLSKTLEDNTYSVDPFQPKADKSNKETVDKQQKKMESSSDEDSDSTMKSDRFNKKANATESTDCLPKHIEKFKGIKAYRKKETKNPRVHNKLRYRKAVIRSKGACRSMKNQLQPYIGESTGINIGVVHSRKLK